MSQAWVLGLASTRLSSSLVILSLANLKLYYDLGDRSSHEIDLICNEGAMLMQFSFTTFISFFFLLHFSFPKQNVPKITTRKKKL